ncbi:PKHD-type hydroxylase PiuC [Novosphingobium endophyticum]|uniref:PKHD-type hydroxylase PiuC n=1 Tax=Novosphingobium endophyticum TaxID=1955250 RepID=A0A916X6E2_9SPHN|nr:Fe2+-dependent dioxygenase [Novosphingobium endophyticum]GGC08155.1 PKHD-type hydroxylase PiuC [Novosphingobium endophyticum]
MLIHVPGVLTPEQVAHCREVLNSTEWVDGRVTAGVQSAIAKNNLQVPEDAPQAQALGQIILQALGANPTFNAAALPLRVFPPLFNRYDEGMGFTAHVDNTIRYIAGARQRMRTDVSSTLFLSEPGDYDGGELVIEDSYGEQRVKLAAGDMALYPADSLHRVEPVTRGSRWAAFFWTQSMVRDDSERALLYNFDRSITLARAELGDGHPAVLGITSTYHNLLRKWAEL